MEKTHRLDIKQPDLNLTSSIGDGISRKEAQKPISWPRRLKFELLLLISHLKNSPKNSKYAELVSAVSDQYSEIFNKQSTLSLDSTIQKMVSSLVELSDIINEIYRKDLDALLSQFDSNLIIKLNSLPKDQFQKSNVEQILSDHGIWPDGNFYEEFRVLCDLYDMAVDCIYQSNELMKASKIEKALPFQIKKSINPDETLLWREMINAAHGANNLFELVIGFARDLTQEIKMLELLKPNSLGLLLSNNDQIDTQTSSNIVSDELLLDEKELISVYDSCLVLAHKAPFYLKSDSRDFLQESEIVGLARTIVRHSYITTLINFLRSCFYNDQRDLIHNIDTRIRSQLAAYLGDQEDEVFTSLTIAFNTLIYLNVFADETGKLNKKLCLLQFKNISMLLTNILYSSTDNGVRDSKEILKKIAELEMDILKSIKQRIVKKEIELDSQSLYPFDLFLELKIHLKIILEISSFIQCEIDRDELSMSEVIRF